MNGSVIKRSGKKILLIPNSTVITHYTALNLRSFNISKDNFLHSKLITDGVDFSSEFRQILLNDDLHAENKYPTFPIVVKTEYAISVYLRNAMDVIIRIKYYIFGFLFLIMGLSLIYILYVLKIFHYLFVYALTVFISVKKLFVTFFTYTSERFRYYLRNCFSKKKSESKHTDPIYKPTFASLMLDEIKKESVKSDSVLETTRVNDSNAIAMSILTGEYNSD